MLLPSSFGGGLPVGRPRIPAQSSDNIVGRRLVDRLHPSGHGRLGWRLTDVLGGASGREP